MKIRLARTEDVPAILEIYRPYVERTAISFEYDVPDLPTFQKRFLSIAAGCPWLVCEEAGEVLGYAYGAPAFERAAYCWMGDVSVYLRADICRRGIGRALYAVLEPMMALQGYQALYAVVTATNETSLRFHRAVGYTDVSFLPDCGFKLGTWYGVVWQCKRLCAPHAPASAPTPASQMDWSSLGFPLLRDDGWTVELSRTPA